MGWAQQENTGHTYRTKMINGHVESIISGGTTNHTKYHVPHRSAGDEAVPRIHVFSSIALCIRGCMKTRTRHGRMEWEFWSVRLVCLIILEAARFVNKVYWTYRVFYFSLPLLTTSAGLNTQHLIKLKQGKTYKLNSMKQWA